MRGLDFHRDGEGYVQFEAEPRLRCLGMWFTGDIQSVHEICLDLLADLVDIAAGRKAHESWEGNAWAAELGPDGVDLQNLWAPLSAHYPLSEVRRAAEQYWRTLSDDPDRTRAIAEWEQYHGRPHPWDGL